MTPGSAEIEQIVREVLARLDLRADQPRPSGGNSPAGIPAATTQTAPADSLTLAERVITADLLSRRLNGVRQVMLLAGAIVTPSAKDLLRERNIGWSFGLATSTTAASAGRTLFVGVADSTFCPAALVRGLAKHGVQVQQVASAGLVPVTQELSEQVALSGSLALLLTASTAAAVCVANRRRGVRAIQAGTMEQLVAGIEAIGANLLILDPAATSYFQLQRTITRFCDPAPRNCPKHLNGTL